MNRKTEVQDAEIDQLLFFALRRLYPKESDTDITKMLNWAKRRLRPEQGKKH